MDGEPQNQNQNQNQNQADWRESMPQDIREAVKASAKAGTFKGAEMLSVPRELVTTFLGQEEVIGKKEIIQGIIKPEEGAPKEKWDEFHKALGRPDKPEDYSVAKPENMSEEQFKQIFPDAAMQSARKVFYEAGISKENASKILTAFAGIEMEALARMESEDKQTRAQVEADLRKEFGAKYDEHYGAIEKTLLKLSPGDGNKEFRELIVSSARGDIRFSRLMGEIAKHFVEDSGGGGNPSTNLAGLEAAQKRIDEINKELGSISKTDPKKDALLAERNKLYEVTSSK